MRQNHPEGFIDFRLRLPQFLICPLSKTVALQTAPISSFLVNMCNAPRDAVYSRVSAVPALPGHLISAVAKNMPSQAKNVSTKRVSFNESVRVYPHLHYNNFTENELAESWYDDQEMDAIKVECLQTIQLAVNDRLDDNNNFWCFRGLEYRTTEGARKRRENKIFAWNAVMNEQETQQMVGEFNDGAIAEVYADASAASQEAAYVLAFSDAKAVQQDRFLEKASNKHAKRIGRKVFTFPSPARSCSAAA